MADINNGLSVASDEVQTPVNSPVITRADQVPSQGSPQAAVALQSSTERLVQARVPLDTPQYYTLIKINHYGRASWREVGNLELESGVIFPFPAVMIDNQNMSYEIQPLGFLAGMGFDAVARGATAINSQSDVSRVIAETAAGLTANAAVDGLGRVLAGAAGKFGDAVLGAAGISVNDFMTVMFRGPTYTRRDFQWRFSPKTAEESEELRKAILVLKTAAAASLAGFGGSAFFGWPRIFEVEFKNQNYPGNTKYDNGYMTKQTFRMKPAVCTDISVNYTPIGQWAAYGKTKAPESVDLRMSFLELEFWLNSTRRSRDAFDHALTPPDMGGWNPSPSPVIPGGDALPVDPVIPFPQGGGGSGF